MPRAIALWLVLVGCGATDIDRDVCGNGIVEAGEDCDSIDPRCSACGIVCATTDDCVAYGDAAGFVCGADLFCHAPAGRFEAARELALPVTTFRITDVSQDGQGDVVLQSQTAVTAVFADAAVASLSNTSILTPTAQGVANYADLDRDGSLDVVMPTVDGIVAYTAPFGVPSPYPFPSFVDQSVIKPLFAQLVINDATNTHLAIIGAIPGGTALTFAIVDARTAPPEPLGQASVCNAEDRDFASDDANVFVLSPGHEIVAVTLRPPNGPPRLCVLAVDLNGNGTYAVQPIALAPTAPPQSRPVVAALRAGICPSMLLAQGSSGAASVVEYLPIATNPCSFQPTPRVVPGVPLGALPVGVVPLLPTVSGASPTAVVLTTGVYTFQLAGAVLAEMHRADRPIANVRSADLDRDGQIDIITSSKNAVALDLLYRIAPGFIPFRFDTESEVVNFLIGDFDGNTIPDIAYVERRVADERLLIAFGTADKPLPGATVGTFKRVLSVIDGDIPDSTDRFNVISDLAVIFDVGIGAQLAILHGSPQQTMLAFFDPRPQPADPDGRFRAVVAGSFGGAAAVADLLAIETSPTSTNLWLSQGATGGTLQMSQTPSTASTTLRDCKGVQVPVGAFCVNDSQLLAWPERDRDLVVGVDANGQLIAFDPRDLTPGVEAPVASFRDRFVTPPNSLVRGLSAITIEDGTNRLLANFGPVANAGDPRLAGAVNLCTFDVVAGPECVDVSAAVSTVAGEVTCVDAGFAHVAPARRFEPPDPEADLVVLCHAGLGETLYRVSIDGARVSVLAEIGTGDALQVGDVTGDGVPDLVIVDRKAAVPVVRVFRQCTSRDLACDGTIGGR